MDSWILMGSLSGTAASRDWFTELAFRTMYSLKLNCGSLTTFSSSCLVRIAEVDKGEQEMGRDGFGFGLGL